MLFSTKAEYGVRLMVELGRRAQGHPDGEAEPVALSSVAEAEVLPLSYLEHLVAKLRQAGLVTSVRGAHGGYRLAQPATEIEMLDVVQALEGPIAPMECFNDEPEGRSFARMKATAIAPAPRSCSGRGSTAGSRRRWPARLWPNWSSSPMSTRFGAGRRPGRVSPRPTTQQNGDRWPIWRSETCT